MNTIDSFSGKFAFLSNFYVCPILLYGITYGTMEHFFQAWKMTNKKDHDLVKACRTAGDAKKLARTLPMRDDWESVKKDVMLIGLREKFFPNRLVTQCLLNTGDSILIEGNTWGDKYWGVCRGVGENNLGKLLMQVRQEVRDAV